MRKFARAYYLIAEAFLSVGSALLAVVILLGPIVAGIWFFATGDICGGITSLGVAAFVGFLVSGLIVQDWESRNGPYI